MTELAATRQFAAGLLRAGAHPMLVKDEIRSICNLPPDGDLTRDAILRDILPFNEHIEFKLTGMVSKNFPQAMDGDATRSERDVGDHTLNGKLLILLKTQGKSVVYLLPTFSSNTK